MKKLMSLFSWSDLRGKLLISFIITAVIPSFVLIFFSYINTSSIVSENASEMMRQNLRQTKSSLDVWADSYEDILFQIYMNDNIVDMLDDINQGKEVELTSAQLRRTLRGMFYIKEHIQCITVITESGHLVFYDLLTGSLTKTSWLETIGMNTEEIYDYFSRDNDMHLLPVSYAGVYASEEYYLFHMGHRIIDYQNVNKQLGVVIVSIDEEMLQEICSSDNNTNNFKFIVNADGSMASSEEKELLGKKVIDWSDNIEERKKGYEKFLKEKGMVKNGNAIVEVVFDEEFSCDIISVSNQVDLMARLNTQQRIMLAVFVLTAVVLLILIRIMIREFMSSINGLVKVMKDAEKGKLHVRSEIDKKTPMEIRIIENQFNHMLDELEISLKNEKEAIDLQRKAEIAALEAQINPHFLYNTLDTINWMAIDNDEFEISNSITALASILRYGIDNSNAQVTVSREVEWLKQYIFLQQTRLKNTFECDIHAAQEVLDWKIHKLLFQPFVENAIYHGFKVEKEVYILRVEIEPEGERLMIRIWDNGTGMREELIDMINREEYPKSEDKNCIGMKNAIERIKMYYGNRAEVCLESRIGEYTSVRLYIPKITR